MSWNTNVWRCVTSVFRADTLSKVSKLVHQLAHLLACLRVHCQFFCSLSGLYYIKQHVKVPKESDIIQRVFVCWVSLSVSWDLQLISCLGYKIHIEPIKICDLPVLYLILLWGLGWDRFLNIYSFPKYLHHLLSLLLTF